MGIGWMILIFFGGIFVFFLLLGKLTWGTGADLVDFDPEGHAEERRARDAEDLAQMEAIRPEIDRQRRDELAAKVRRALENPK